MFLDQNVQNERAVIVQHFLNGVIQLGWVRYLTAFTAKRLGQLHEVRQAFRPAVRIALAVQ